MSDPINANPTIIDVANLPTRIGNNGANSVDGYGKKSKQDELLEKVLSLSLLTPEFSRTSSLPDASTVPDLVSDVEMESSTDDELVDEIDEESLLQQAAEAEEEDLIDEQEIFDLIATISDPEHPLTLAQLAVVNLHDIKVTHGANKYTDISEVLIRITPTITHCSLATLIGLGIRVRLERSLPPRFRIRILIKEGTHQSENQVNKQLNDKERVAAACENDQLLSVISQMLSSCK
ncbi:uncharacterized protein RJT20DRAFT_57351 [Scheffersomyces xylosifermentans]|uniref:uncharacterized protein n=1 Tax=Scheffersomyces xylosifermentans TaxID=1304137 RepID=UPI00315DEC79